MTSSARCNRVSHVTRPMPAPTSSARIRLVRVTNSELGWDFELVGLKAD